MKKNILFVILLSLLTIFPLAGVRADEQAASAETKITICPAFYAAGEETFYLQGTAPADSQLTLRLKRDEKIIKEWVLAASSQGDWSFSNNELFPLGDYLFSIQDQNGFVDQCRTKIKPSGLAYVLLKISYKDTASILAGALFVLLIATLVVIHRKQQTKKKLAKEIFETKDILSVAFANLDRQIGAKIEQIDARPGFNPAEMSLYQELKQKTKHTQELIRKEIEDIEKFI